MFKSLMGKKPIEIFTFGSSSVNGSFLVNLDSFHTKACKDFMFLGKLHDLLTNKLLPQIAVGTFIFLSFIFMLKVLISDPVPSSQFFIRASFLLLASLSLPLVNKLYYFKKYKSRVKFHFLEALNSSFGERKAVDFKGFLSALSGNENMTFNDLTASSWKSLFCETFNQEETFDAFLPNFDGSLNDLKAIIDELS